MDKRVLLENCKDMSTFVCCILSFLNPVKRCQRYFCSYQELLGASDLRYNLLLSKTVRLWMDNGHLWGTSSIWKHLTAFIVKRLRLCFAWQTELRAKTMCFYSTLWRRDSEAKQLERFTLQRPDRRPDLSKSNPERAQGTSQCCHNMSTAGYCTKALLGSGLVLSHPLSQAEWAQNLSEVHTRSVQSKVFLQWHLSSVNADLVLLLKRFFCFVFFYLGKRIHALSEVIGPL